MSMDSGYRERCWCSFMPLQVNTLTTSQATFCSLASSKYWEVSAAGPGILITVSDMCNFTRHLMLTPSRGKDTQTYLRVNFLVSFMPVAHTSQSTAWWTSIPMVFGFCRCTSTEVRHWITRNYAPYQPYNGSASAVQIS